MEKTSSKQEILELVKEKLIKMRETPIDRHNDYTEEHSQYQRRFASKLLIDIRKLEEKYNNK